MQHLQLTRLMEGSQPEKYAIQEITACNKIGCNTNISIQIFDRDEPAKEKEVYVTVQASDDGIPRLDAVCTLKVQITDINDNTAQFLLSR